MPVPFHSPYNRHRHSAVPSSIPVGLRSRSTRPTGSTSTVDSDIFATGENTHSDPLMGERAKKGVVDFHHSLVEPPAGGDRVGSGLSGGGLHTRPGSALSVGGDGCLEHFPSRHASHRHSF